MKHIHTLILALFLSVSLVAQEKQNNFEIAKSLDIYNSLLRELNLNYVDEINPGELNETAITLKKDETAQLTAVITPSDATYQTVTWASDKTNVATVDANGKVTAYTRISEPYYGWPAQKAGLIAGDAIIEVNGVDCVKKNTQEVSNLLKGQPGTEVKLKIKRYGQDKPLEITLKREKVKIDNIPYYKVFDNGVAYLSLSGFTRDAAKELKDKFVEMRKDRQLTGFILDLRGNGGGLMNEAVDIVNLFIPKGKPVVSMKGKATTANNLYPTTNEPLDLEIPLAILVDGNSASASEIVAGAIQDYDRGVIIGQRTFGKGLVQNILPLSYNTQLKVTVAHYYIPSGRCIQEIDYSKRNDKGQAQHIPDSLTKVFYTAAGRPVRDGGGIRPDVVCKPDTMPDILYAISQNVVLFDFVNEWCSKHPSIAPMDEFVLTDDDYNAFKDFVCNSDFEFVSNSSRALESLMKIARAEGLADKAQDEFRELRDKLQYDLKNDLDVFRTDLEKLIAIEIVVRYYYQQAVVLLDDAGRYRSILAAPK